MLLSRMGNKSRIAAKIYNLFPPHKLYIELFFGAGGMFFNKPKANYNIVNDIDSDVFNLFNVVIHNYTELIDKITIMPIHDDLFQYWRDNKETDSILKACRFLLLSNFSYMGANSTLHFSIGNQKKIILENIKETNTLLHDIQFMNCDFREVFKRIHFRHLNDINTAFIYADPPYLYTKKYETEFKESDFTDLVTTCINSKCRFAISEFDNEYVINEANKNNLFITQIGERQNLKNTRNEILITNYKNINLFTF